MEEKAALGRLQEFAAQHTGEAPSLFAGRSVLAAQYALEALGFMKFVNGPDNDYGPSTIEAVGKAQAHYGRDETRWLSHAELRELLCDAATLKSDPISYFHLGVMFAEGQGFPQDLDRAAYAIGRADELLIAQLANADGLPDWKRRHYPTFRPQIERARELLAAVRAADGDVKIKVTNENLCAMR
jgi:TPR repeat protein